MQGSFRRPITGVVDRTDLVQPRASRRAPRWRLHAVYVALAALGVTAVGLGLYLSDRTATLYREAVGVNQTWASLQLRYLALGPLAAAVNAPGNDVFDSHDVPAERARLDLAARLFDERLALLRDRPRDASSAADTSLTADLEAVAAAMAGMRAEATAIFAAFEEAAPEAAAARMASMDRYYAGVRRAIDALSRDVAAEQSRQLAAQADAAAHLYRVELGIAACLLLLVGTAIAYGVRAVGQVQADALERDRHMAALEASALALETARRQAEEASQVKSAFLATMSHELRTPLNAVIGYSELLADDAVEQGHEGAAADLNRITAAGRHLLALVNDILDLSKIEANRLELESRAVDLSGLVEDVASTVQPLMHANGNAFTVHCGDDLGTVTSDPTRLRQVLLNLLSNAAKFTEQGRVTLTACRVDDGDAPRIEFVVADSGIGIPADRLATLFAPFVQADPSMTRRFGGSGLGLAISREICRRLGGDVVAT
ncbi:MAG: ATP-binding protein, partial [Vicinamibacterales bacterium]